MQEQIKNERERKPSQDKTIQNTEKYREYRKRMSKSDPSRTSCECRMLPATQCRGAWETLLDVERRLLIFEQITRYCCTYVDVCVRCNDIAGACGWLQRRQHVVVRKPTVALQLYVSMDWQEMLLAVRSVRATSRVGWVHRLCETLLRPLRSTGNSPVPGLHHSVAVLLSAAATATVYGNGNG